VRARSIVGDDPGHRRAFGRGRIGPELEAMERSGAIEVVEDHPGLDPRRPGIGIHLDDSIKITRTIQD